jgi:hypothetical protein
MPRDNGKISGAEKGFRLMSLIRGYLRQACYEGVGFAAHRDRCADIATKLPYKWVGSASSSSQERGSTDRDNDESALNGKLLQLFSTDTRTFPLVHL